MITALHCARKSICPGRYLSLLIPPLLVLLCVSSTAHAQNHFPCYSEIQKNVTFWKDVYDKYDSTQGILHDRTDPTIIYTVVNLINWEFPKAGKINRQITRLARKRIKKILLDLGHGKKPATEEEKKIASLFPRNKPAAFLQARENIRLQVGQKDRFYRGVIRSGKYIGQLKKIFRAYGLPEELAYLPHVESSFYPLANSKADARGLWQFTAGTGKQYLTINELVDERLDPHLSSHAAAKLLKENYSQLKTWPLALTAYNYGRAGMIRAVKEHKTYQKVFLLYNKGYFKFASRNFYSEFLAALEIAKKLENDPKLKKHKPEATLTVRLPGYASCARMRTFFKVGKQDFARLNPALRPSVLNDTLLMPKGYLMRLPATKKIRTRLSQLNQSLFSGSQVAHTYHIVRKGESVSAIAQQHHTSARTINRLNNLPKNSTIRIGQKLKIPYNKEKVLLLKTKGKRTP
ncbi:MAG: hypothetical protein CSA20_00805 [Deltaproteobacteria bacterium]|nr:MAG: hypothetical protein CSA20_00805 [Deltaproteobacteria bacterium]